MTANIQVPPTSTTKTHPKYRADIDGLRALAVLSVVAFHAYPDLLSGGFIGVDIFFVISGFLISSIIFSGLASNTFSFSEFYTRRIKRIFPALLVVLAASYALGWFALLAAEYAQLGKHMAAGAGFVSNFALWKESGYFDNAAGTKPMLHLWSLGVEEQFYIVWPLTLWFAWKQRLNPIAVIALVGLASFLLNIFTVSTDRVAAFYSPQTRFWELLIGSALASSFLQNSDIYKAVTRPKNALSMLGAALIGAAVILIDEKNAFPGWLALLPTMGAALIIAAGADAWLNRSVLSHPQLVWIGLISYPLYLWHWPLLSFARIIQGTEPPLLVRNAAVVSAIALAWITYKFVEKPIRSRQLGREKIVALTASMILLGSVGYYTYKVEGIASRVAALPQVANKGEIGHDVFASYMLKNFYFCTPEYLQKEALWSAVSIRCFQSKKSGPVTVAIIGDSHAEDLFLGLAEQKPDINIVYYIKNSLPITSNKEFDNIFKVIADDKNIKTVIISANWGGASIKSMEKLALELRFLKPLKCLSLTIKIYL